MKCLGTDVVTIVRDNSKAYLRILLGSVGQVEADANGTFKVHTHESLRSMRDSLKERLQVIGEGSVQWVNDRLWLTCAEATLSKLVSDSFAVKVKS